MREKGARGTWGSIPRLTSGWGGAQRRGDGSGRRRLWWRVAAALALGRMAGGGGDGCGVEERRWGAFYSPSRTVERHGVGDRLSEVCGQPLMELGRSRALRSGASSEATAQDELAVRGRGSACLAVAQALARRGRRRRLSQADRTTVRIPLACTSKPLAAQL